MDKDYELDYLKNGFTQFAVDNVNHSTDTLDDKVTCYGMGIIAFSILNKETPEKKWRKYQQI